MLEVSRKTRKDDKEYVMAEQSVIMCCLFWMTWIVLMSLCYIRTYIRALEPGYLKIMGAFSYNRHNFVISFYLLVYYLNIVQYFLLRSKEV